MKLEQVPTPSYIIDLAKLEENCSILQEVEEKAGCKVLLAQKAYSLYKTYPLISQYLSGTTASGLFEAKLAREEFPGEVHVFAPAFKESDMEELLQISVVSLQVSKMALKRLFTSTMSATIRNATLRLVHKQFLTQQVFQL